jgi:hypothetical protein
MRETEIRHNEKKAGINRRKKWGKRMRKKI